MTIGVPGGGAYSLEYNFQNQRGPPNFFTSMIGPYSGTDFTVMTFDNIINSFSVRAHRAIFPLHPARWHDRHPIDNEGGEPPGCR